MRSTLLAFALTTLIAVSASAQPARRDHSRVSASVGLFTPTGDLGVEYTQALGEHLEIGVGAGMGLFVRTGAQGAVMPRLRQSWGPLTATLGAGVSVGRYDNISPFAEDNAPRILSMFGNVEAGLQYTTHVGLFARAYAGTGKILTHEGVMGGDPMVKAELDDVIPYGGVATGWTF